MCLGGERRAGANPYLRQARGRRRHESLCDSGMREGSPNVRPGEGTANRRFFFRNGMLELRWVVHVRGLIACSLSNRTTPAAEEAGLSSHLPLVLTR